MLTLQNIKQKAIKKYPLLDRQIYKPEEKWDKYVLEEEVNFKLSNGDYLKIEEGFLWDKSSVPRLLWTLLPPSGKFEIAALIHDKIYKDLKYKYTRKFADKEMLKWSMALQGTKNFSFSNLDNYARYLGVRIGGWLAWYDII